ncbi:MAG: hypothetical protein NTY12_05160 [Candidatus Falkowbacteria bacterium]|nr:hypothetical protein [Candidatus Falkowbacteria bacterium]
MKIPIVPKKNLDLETRQSRLDNWKQFLQKQKIINCITDKPEINNLLTSLIDELRLTKDKIAFIVSFPKSSKHLNDFNNHLPNAIAHAIFHETGKVEIIGTGIKQSYNFNSAWEEIIQRSTNNDDLLIISSPPIKSKIDEAIRKATRAEKTLARNLNRWLKIFNATPGIRAKAPYQLENSDTILYIYYHDNPAYLIDAKLSESKGNSYASLYSDGSIRFNTVDENKKSSAHDTWRGDMEEAAIEKHSLQWLYENILALYKQYSDLIPEITFKK